MSFFGVSWNSSKRSNSKSRGSKSSESPGLYSHKQAAMSDSALFRPRPSSDDSRRLSRNSQMMQMQMPIPPRVVQSSPTPQQPTYQVNYVAVPMPTSTSTYTAPRPSHSRSGSQTYIQPQQQQQPQYYFPTTGGSNGGTYIRAPSPAPPVAPAHPRRRTHSDASNYRPDPTFLKSLRASGAPPTSGPVPPTATYSSSRRQPPPPAVIKFYEKDEPHYGFTNFSPHQILYRDQIYPTSEHLFQAMKFIDHRPGLAEHIRTASDRSGVAFSEARRFTPEIRSDWRQMSISAMEEVLSLKFKQHKALRKELLDTGDAYLIEDAGRNDAFWGNGPDGNGRNELGLALMRLRQKLRER